MWPYTWGTPVSLNTERVTTYHGPWIILESCTNNLFTNYREDSLFTSVHRTGQLVPGNTSLVVKTRG